MIRLSHGDLLRADAEALVNTVNTVGVMGKGIALQFKKAYPAMFECYRKAAKAGDLVLGRVQVWETGQMTNPRYIINGVDTDLLCALDCTLDEAKAKLVWYLATQELL